MSRKYEIRHFEPHHYVMLMDNIEQERGIPGNPALAFKNSHSMLYGGVARSGFYDEQLITCGGLILPWPGYAIAWALVSRLGRKHPAFIHRTFDWHLHEWIEKYALKRVEASVDVNFGQGQRWVQKLGFKEESIMPNYGPLGQTFVRYVILT